jgi:hypothetical protein
MNAPQATAAAIVFSLFAMSAETALAWNTRWQFRQNPLPGNGGSGTAAIGMQKKFDLDPMKTFRGTTDGGSGYTVMRNLNGGAMRGYINKDGASLLRDQNGSFHSVNPRWQTRP